MQKFLQSLIILATLFLATPLPAAQATNHEPFDQAVDGKCVRYSDADRSDKKLAPLVDGVLIQYGIKEGGFSCYAFYLLYENMVYIIFIAMALTVYSGVQYMLAMGSAEQQGQAKQRIIGIVGGIIFYFLIAAILRLLAFGLTL